MSLADGVNGWLLRHHAQGNTSLVLDIFTLEVGRVAVLAKGGRKNPHIQPFRPLWLSATGKARLPLVRQLEAAGNAVALTGKALWCSYYLNELLLRLLPDSEPAIRIFSAYGETLENLSHSQELQRPLRHFEMLLLAECGYALELHHDCQGQPLTPNAYYQWSEDGLQLAPNGMAGHHLIAFRDGHWNDDIANISRQLLRRALAQQLGPAPLKSRELFRDLSHPEA